MQKMLSNNTSAGRS